MNLTKYKVHCPFESGALDLIDDFLELNESEKLFCELINTDHWNKGIYTVSGRRFYMPRYQTWYADRGVRYNFSYELHAQRDWTAALFSLKRKIENYSGAKFNSVLINWYRNGQDWVDWHSDNENELGDNPVIASVSLGESRNFYSRHKLQGGFTTQSLHNGSLLVMYPEYHRNWQHCVPLSPETQNARINLTFRYVVMPD